MTVEKNFVKKAEAQKSAPKQKKAWRPKMSEKPAVGEHCPHCGADVDAGDAICGSCGRSLTSDKCSFCGAPMKPGARFCTHCGQSREGVVCPNCGTVNARNFCRKCNSPLTAMAQKALEQAARDPQFLAIKRRAEELAELHRQIEELQNEGPEDAPCPELSDADKALIDEYAAILGSIGVYKPASKPADAPVKKQSAPEQPKFKERTKSLEDIMAAYRAKADEMNAALAELAPPPDFTPEQQRDYYTARKIAVVETSCELIGYQPNMWVCNFCGCKHCAPPECTRPELGGHWVYVTPEEYIAENPGIKQTTSLKIL